MDPNSPLGKLDYQQLMHLASLGRNQLMQQQSGQFHGQFSQVGDNNTMLPQPDMNTMHFRPPFQSHGGSYAAVYGHGPYSDWGGAVGSSEPTRADSPIRNMQPIDIEETSPPPKNNPPRKNGSNARQKGKQARNEEEPTKIKKDNFQPHEDRMLVMSWLEISCDPMTNTGQTHEAFWDKITALYNSKRASFPERSKRSLQSRYDTIKKPVGRFSSYYADVVRRNPSGMTDADKTTLACTEYAECEPKPFKFMHCWEIMKDNPKFQDTKHGRNYRDGEDNYQGQQFNPPTEQQEAEQSCPTPSTTTSKRPMGRDAAKKAAKKRAGSSTSNVSEFAQSMHDLVIKYNDNEINRRTRHDSYLDWKKEEQKDARMDRKVLIKLERKKVRIEEHKLAIKKKHAEAEHQRVQMMRKQEEERILSIDLSKYQEPLRTHYQKWQEEIMDAHKRD